MSGPVNDDQAKLAFFLILGGILGIGFLWWATPCMAAIGVVVLVVWGLQQIDFKSGGK